MRGLALVPVLQVLGVTARLWRLRRWRLGRGRVRHYRLALFGGIALTSFIIIRAASFHYVDKLLGVRLSYLRLNFILEVGGVMCIGIAAFKSWRELLRPASSPKIKGAALSGPEAR